MNGKLNNSRCEEVENDMQERVNVLMVMPFFTI